MDRQILEMCGILEEEGLCFHELCELEEKKTAAIIAHDGRLLEKISIEQEGILDRLYFLDVQRMERMNALKARRLIEKNASTLADLIARLEEDSAVGLKERGAAIKTAAARLGRKRETNRALMRDNMDYYQILLAGLRRETNPDRGYGQDGREEESLRSSILFNQTA